MEHKGNAQMIAHRGLSGLERENTAAAFVAAGNRSYFGIETDIHQTADGKFIIIHDDTTGRVSNDNYSVEQTDFEQLRDVKILDQDGGERADLVLPTLEEYISICKRYGKTAVLELKNEMPAQAVLEIARRIEEADYLDGTIFISFALRNLIALREAYPQQAAQYLVFKIEPMEELLSTLKKYHFDIDAMYTCVTKENVEEFHKNGIKINVWAVDTVEEAERLEEFGVDYITTDILE